MKQPVDPNTVVVWQLEFRFSTKNASLVHGTHFIQALQNEPAHQLYDRFFNEIDIELRAEHGDYQLRGCNIRPAIVKED